MAVMLACQLQPPANALVWIEFHLCLASFAGDEPQKPVTGLILNIPTCLEVQKLEAEEGAHIIK